jgi:hypothetical protein
LIRAWGAVGTREYKSAQQIGTLTNIAAVTQQVCPTGSIANSSQKPGVTTDGYGKKQINTCPLPVYPRDWNNGVYQWVPATTNVISAGQCKF